MGRDPPEFRQRSARISNTGRRNQLGANRGGCWGGGLICLQLLSLIACGCLTGSITVNHSGSTPHDPVASPQQTNDPIQKGGKWRESLRNVPRFRQRGGAGGILILVPEKPIKRADPRFNDVKHLPFPSRFSPLSGGPNDKSERTPSNPPWKAGSKCTSGGSTPSVLFLKPSEEVREQLLTPRSAAEPSVCLPIGASLNRISP